MDSGKMLVIVLIAVFFGVGQIAGCVNCEQSGGAYVRTIYGWHECVKK